MKYPRIDYYSIGIDPGVHGGICILSPDRRIVELTPMPESELGIWMWLNPFVTRLKLHSEGRDTKFKAMIEKVGGYIPRNRSGKDNKDSGDRGSHMFVFGRNYGACVMALMALDVPCLTIPPRVWQKYYNISPRNREGGETDSQFKNRLKDKAKELYLEEKITLQTCDAILLSHYCSIT